MGKLTCDQDPSWTHISTMLWACHAVLELLHNSTFLLGVYLESLPSPCH